MAEADRRLEKQERVKAVERANQIEQRAEQAELSRILKEEREQ